MENDYYLLWKYDSDGVPDLVWKFHDYDTAKLIARIMASQDEYKNHRFCIEEF